MTSTTLSLLQRHYLDGNDILTVTIDMKRLTITIDIKEVSHDVHHAQSTCSS